MKRELTVLALVAAATVVAACGSSSSPTSDPVTAAQAPPAAVATTAPPVPPVSACQEPSGQEKAALRFAVQGHDQANDVAGPWARVRRHGVNYMAAALDVQGAPALVAVVRYPQSGQYLAGMRAVNGTARTFTNLPDAASGMPAAATEAAACVS